VKGRFATVLLTIGKIEPGEQKSYEEVAGQIKQVLAETRARSTISDLRDKVEDERADRRHPHRDGQEARSQGDRVEAVDRSGRARTASRLPTFRRPPT